MEDATVLVLSRKIGETICLDGNIEVVVTAIHGNRVSLGISAPKTVGIRRSELSESSAPNASAAAGGLSHLVRHGHSAMASH